MQGHFASELIPGRVLYPYGLFCDNRLDATRSDGGPSFRFSDQYVELYVDPILGPIYGSGRVSFNNNPSIVNFTGHANFGFRDGDCRVIHSSDPTFSDCGGSTCVVRTSNPDQGFIADCNNDTMPYPHDFQYKICCTPREICNDGIDNTGDGLIDCASPDCHPRTYVDPISGVSISQPPQQCAPGPSPGNSQFTSNCVLGYDSTTFEPIFNDSCVGPHPNPLFPGQNQSFYCSYGVNDDPDSNPEGFCCPEGTYYDSFSNTCEFFQRCGLEASLFCVFNFFSQQSSWLSSFYDGSENWCQSYLPNLRLGISRSEACCPVITHGTFGFYIVDENIKIFGAE